MKKSWITPRIWVAALALGLVAMPALANNVKVQAAAGAVSWQVEADNAGSTLVVHGKDGFVQSRKFEAGEAPIFQVPGDGAYRWHLVVQPRLSEAQKAELRAARDRGVSISAEDVGGFSESGYFSVIGGVVSIAAGDVDQGWGDADIPTRDQVIADDLIVQGSECVGVDCVNNANFGFDTILLKENNLRIKFEDTSTGSFPSVDWQLTANDSASGGQNKFSIDDITNGKTPFTVEAAAATNSIYIDSTARVGFRTASPVLDLHVVTGNSPGLRLEQDGSSGFTAQTWDLAGNEAVFFVRDVTNGSKLPFKIQPGAGNNSLVINSSGDIGVGTLSPSAAIQVNRSTGAILEGVRVTNNNEARISLENTNITDVMSAAALRYIMAVNNVGVGEFFISRNGGGGPILEVLQRNDGGGVPSVIVTGSVQATNVSFTSSREKKEGFTALDPQEILAKVAELPVTKWRFKEGSQVDHIGPMAEDFHEAFGLNSDNKTISMTDTSGVALAAIQGLLQQVQTLKQQNAVMSDRLQLLEGKLQDQK